MEDRIKNNSSSNKNPGDVKPYQGSYQELLKPLTMRLDTLRALGADASKMKAECPA